MSRLSASWLTFVRPSLRTYERGETRDDFDVHAAASDLTLKISSFSKDTESTHFTADTKAKGRPPAHSIFFPFSSLFFFFFLGEGGLRKLCECRQTPPVVVVSFRVQCGGRYDGTSNGCVPARCVHAAPSASVMILCSTRVCSGACDKHACDS
jgi:hypothetical protein